MSQAAIASGSADAPYWQALSEGKLKLQHCDCGIWHWPAVWRCGECGRWDPEWKDVTLKAQVYSWQKTWHAFGGTEDIGLPYVTVLAALPQAGERRLLGLFDGEVEQLTTGAELEGRITETLIAGNRIPSLRWRLR